MCPLCHHGISDYYGNVCPSCYKKFNAEKSIAKKHPEMRLMPEAIADTIGESGYHLWLAGKVKQLIALNEGKCDDEAEKIGFAEMEKKLQEQNEANARRDARIARERAMQSRLFRHI